MALRLSGLQNIMLSVCVGRIRHLCRHPATAQMQQTGLYYVGRISAAPSGKHRLLCLLHHLQQRIQQARETDIQILAAQ